MVLAAIEQRDHSVDVLPVVQQGLGHRLADLLLPGDVHDGVHAVLPQHLPHQVPIPNTAHHQRNIGDTAAITGGEIIDHHDIEAVGHHRPGDVRTDVSGSARHQPRHASDPIRARSKTGLTRKLQRPPGQVPQSPGDTPGLLLPFAPEGSPAGVFTGCGRVRGAGRLSGFGVASGRAGWAMLRGLRPRSWVLSRCRSRGAGWFPRRLVFE